MTFLHGLEIYDTYQIFASRQSLSFLNSSVNCCVQIGLDLAFRANFNLITIQKISLRAPWRISLTSRSRETCRNHLVYTLHCEENDEGVKIKKKSNTKGPKPSIISIQMMDMIRRAGAWGWG